MMERLPVLFEFKPDVAEIEMNPGIIRLQPPGGFKLLPRFAEAVEVIINQSPDEVDIRGIRIVCECAVGIGQGSDVIPGGNGVLRFP